MEGGPRPRVSCLVEERDFVAGADDALHHDGAIYAGRAAVVFGHAAHDFRVRQSGVGVKRDHLAAGIAVCHRDLRLRADTQPAPDPLVLAEALTRCQVDVRVGAEAFGAQFPPSSPLSCRAV